MTGRLNLTSAICGAIGVIIMFLAAALTKVI